MQGSKLITTDVIGTSGNVTIQIMNKNDQIISERIIHNEVTNAGMANLLRVLTTRTYSYIDSIAIVYQDPAIPTSEEFQKIFTEFSSVAIRSGVQPYAEFRFYLSSDQLNGFTLTGAKLLTKNMVNQSIEFASVRISDVIDGTTDPVLKDGAIAKTDEISILYVWRIGITSAFVPVIN